MVLNVMTLFFSVGIDSCVLVHVCHSGCKMLYGLHYEDVTQKPKTFALYALWQ